jgi:nucleotide-binding universal stress UspA family protein
MDFMLPFRKILCPTDFSEPSRVALKYASELAAHFEAQLCVLHVVEPTPVDYGWEIYSGVSASEVDRQALQDKEGQLLDFVARQLPPNVKVYPVVCLGSVASEIKRVAEVENADLLVIATHGITGWLHFVFGSVTEKVMRDVHIPVLIIHQPPVNQAEVQEEYEVNLLSL